MSPEDKKLLEQMAVTSFVEKLVKHIATTNTPVDRSFIYDLLDKIVELSGLSEDHISNLILKAQDIK